MIGKLINDRYKVTDLLYPGGQSNVYLAIDQKDKSKVALKSIDLSKADPKRLKQESEIYRIISSKKIQGITPLLDKDNENEFPEFFIFPFRKGNLSSRISQLTFSEQKKYSLRLLEILADLHDNDIIHRDIKPSNILINDSDLPEITDLGIGKTLFTELNVGEDDKTGPIGTRGYAAPEQIAGNFSGKESDIFSLGVLIYQLFSAGNFPKFTTSGGKISKLNYEPLSLNNNKINKDVDVIISKALSVNPDDRFSNAREMLNLLKEALRKKRRLSLNPLKFFKKRPKSTIFLLVIFGAIIFRTCVMTVAQEYSEFQNTNDSGGIPKITINEATGMPDVPPIFQELILPTESRTNDKEWAIKFNKSLELNSQGDYESAIQYLNESLDTVPDEKKFRVHEALSLMNLNRGSWNKALENANKAIEYNNSCNYCYVYKGASETGLFLFAESVSSYSKVLSMPIFEEFMDSIYIIRSTGYAMIGDEDLAIQDLSSAIDFNPNNFIAYFDRATSYYRHGNPANALLDINQAIYFAPAYYRAYEIRGLINIDLKNYEEALSDADQAISLNVQEKNIEGYVVRATVFMMLEDYDQAKKESNNIISIDPENSAGYFLLASTQELMSEYIEANSNYEIACLLEPSDEFICNAKDRFKKEYEKEIEEYEKEVQDNNNNDVDHALGNVKFDSGNYKEAFSIFNELIEIDPDNRNYEYIYKRGVSLVEMQDYENALADLTLVEDAIDLLDDSLFKDLNYFLGKVNYYTGSINKAENYLENCASYKCGNDKIRSASYRYLSLIKYSENSLDDSFGYINLAIDLDPNDPLNYMERGHIYIKKDMHDKALLDYEFSVSLDEKKAEPYIALSNYYFEKNRNESAILNLENALGYGIENHDIYYNLAVNYLNAEWPDDDGGKETDNRIKTIEEYLDKAIELNSNWYRPYRIKAELYSQKSDYEAALENIDTALQLWNFEEPNEIVPRGLGLRNLFSKSEGFYMRAKTLYKWSYYELYKYDDEQSVKEYKENLDKALIDIDSALEIEKEKKYYSLQYDIYSGLENYELALKPLTSLINLSIGEDGYAAPSSYVLRADLYFHLDLYTEAILDFTEAINVGLFLDQDEDELARLYNDRGVAYWYLAEFDKAMEDFEKVFSYDQYQDNAITNLSMLTFYYSKEYDRTISYKLENIANSFYGTSDFYNSIDDADLQDAIKDLNYAFIEKLKVGEGCESIYQDNVDVISEISIYSEGQFILPDYNDCLDYALFISDALTNEYNSFVIWGDALFYSGNIDDAFAIYEEVLNFERDFDPDSNTSYKIVHHYLEKQIESENYNYVITDGKRYINELLNSVNSNKDLIIADIKLLVGVAEMSAGSIDNAINYFTESENFFLETEDEARYIDALIFKSLANLKKDNIQESITQLDKAITDINDKDKNWLSDDPMNLYSFYFVEILSEEDEQFNGKTPTEIREIIINLYGNPLSE